MCERWSAGPSLCWLPGLILGLIVFGFAIALMAASRLGLGPWETFGQGVANRTGLAPGERPGIGTIQSWCCPSGAAE